MSSNSSGKLNTSKSSSARRTATGSSSKNGKEELHKRGTNGEEARRGEAREWEVIRLELNDGKDGSTELGRKQKMKDQTAQPFSYKEDLQ